MRISNLLLKSRVAVNHWFTVMIRNPSLSSCLLLGLLFGLHLYNNEYKNMYYDANGYWELAKVYWSKGFFDFYAYDNILRGYLFPLLLSPLTRLAADMGWQPLDVTRALGLITAAVLFGVALPGLWRAVLPLPAEPVSLSRRLIGGLLGFVLWRGYFNFSLTDFPAFLAVVCGLWGLLRGRSIGSGLVAGVAIAAALNFRPVYAATLPVALLLSLWPRIASDNHLRPVIVWARRFAFVIGLGMVLYPQLLINKKHFDASSPLVLTAKPGERSLYLTQLQWGLHHQKYETNVGHDYPNAQVFFDDRDGQEFAAEAGLEPLTSYAQYAGAALTHPIQFLGVMWRHFFNSLDLQYPTPYISQIYIITWPMALFNYSVLLVGIGTLLSLSWQRWTSAGAPAIIALLALLLPCAASLPSLVECRFLIPVHLLFCTAAAYGSHPMQAWQVTSPLKRLLGLSLYGVLIVGCFWQSANTQSQLSEGPRALFEQQEPPQVLKPW